MSSGTPVLNCGIEGGMPTTSFKYTEIQCDQINLPTNMVGGSVDPCFDGQVLTALSDTSCSLEC